MMWMHVSYYFSFRSLLLCLTQVHNGVCSTAHSQLHITRALQHQIVRAAHIALHARMLSSTTLSCGSGCLDVIVSAVVEHLILNVRIHGKGAEEVNYAVEHMCRREDKFISFIIGFRQTQLYQV